MPEQPKILTCLFLPDVFCVYRKTAEFAVMDRCAKCVHYDRFMREMEEEEDRFWKWEERVRREGYGR